ncbi:hypothetical protein ACHAPT_008461 [Fusarium lateritium]
MCLCFPRRRGAKKQEQQDTAAEGPRPVQLPSKPTEEKTRDEPATAPQQVKMAEPAKAPKPYQARWQRPVSKDKESLAYESTEETERKRFGDRKPAQSSSGGTGAANTQNQSLANSMNMQAQQQIAAGDTSAFTPEHRPPAKENKPARIERRPTPPPPEVYGSASMETWKHFDYAALSARRGARTSDRYHSDTHTSTGYSRPSSSGGGGGGGGYSGGGGGGCDSGGGGGSSDW